MKVLVTGLGGFTGNYIRQELEQSDHMVVGLRSNLTDANAVKEEVQAVQPQAVIHLAAISYVPDGDSLDVYAVNTLGTMNLLNAIAELNELPGKVVLASSSNVYGMQEGVLHEGLCPGPVNHYGCSKLSMEHLAATYYDKLPIVITRPFNYTGVGQPDKFLVPKIVSHFAQKKEVIELGNIDVERDFSDVRWVSKAYCSIIEQGVVGECYNLCSGTATSIKSIIATLESITSHKIEIKVNPDFVRSNDIKSQYGDSTKIMSLIDDSSYMDFTETLSWMIQSSQYHN